MKQDDAAQFAEILGALGLAYRTELDVATIRAYWEFLRDIALVDITSAAQQAVQQLKFFPTVSELRELAQGTHTDNAELAWGECIRAIRAVGYYRSPDFEDAAINATVRHLGGWMRLCELPSEEIDKWYYKDFRRVYGMYIRRGVSREAGAPLEGYFNTTNGFHGYPQIDYTTVPCIGREPIAISHDRSIHGLLPAMDLQLPDVGAPATHHAQDAR